MAARGVRPRAPSPVPAAAAILGSEHGAPLPGDLAAIRDQALAADAALLLDGGNGRPAPAPGAP